MALGLVTSFARATFVNVNDARRNDVREAFHHSWKGYTENCYGRDDIEPDSGTCGTYLNMSLTLVDALDTLLIMGFTEEFDKASDYVTTNLDVTGCQIKHSSLFETNIRVMGGLLSAHALSGDEGLLDKAMELGEMFKNNFHGNAFPQREIGSPFTYGTNLAEIGSLFLEFNCLSQASGDQSYVDLADGILNKLHNRRNASKDGLYPTEFNMYFDQFDEYSDVGIGAMADSFYEYLVKTWILTGKTDDRYISLYREAMEGMKTHLLNHNGDRWFVSNIKKGVLEQEYSHLTCFLPGTLALGALHRGEQTDALNDEDFTLAIKLSDTCVSFYEDMPSGLSPDYLKVAQNGDIADPSQKSSGDYHLRPETVESLFYLWRATHDQKYRDQGWEIFTAIQENCRAKYGYTSIKYSHGVITSLNEQPSWFLAETMKYLYLLFSDDDVIPLNEYVFNTEAHPLPIKKNFPHLTEWF